MAVADELGQCFYRRLEGTPIRDRNLADADDLVDEDDIVDDGAGQRSCRDLVTACVDICGDAVGLERAGLGKEIRVAASHTVGAQAADDCGHPGADDVADEDLRGAIGVSALTTATGDVDVRVDEPRHGGQTAGIDDRGMRQVGHRFDGDLPDVGDLLPLDENVLLTESFRGEDFGPLQQYHHFMSSPCRG